MSESPSGTASVSHAPAGGFAAISKYNPHLWSAEQLRAIFVTRQNELADLRRALRTTPADTVGQHVLLVGARGMGKSTLMQRLALAVEDEADLHRAWLPLRFPEEQYTVSTVGQFWANVLDSLIDALERQGQATAALDATAQRIEALPAAEQAAACLEAINHCADERGQRLLLLVDNTDLLLHNIGRDAHWALRETLQSNSRLLWVGGSYQSLEADSDYHDAFLDFFHTVELRPLRLPEMKQALLALAATFGGDAAKQAMQRQLAAHPERLPTLRQLSGGNPRTTVMLYELFANGQKSDVRGDLEALLDSMTPLYKARMDSLADLPRKLLAHILEHWAPISLGQLAETSQVVNTSISPQLKRLELDGLIQKTRLHGTTRSGYQVAERFFNIWYLMRFSPRRQRARLSWLVEFMRLWFSSDELCGLAQQRMGGIHGRLRCAYNWEYDRALADALPPEARERHALRWALLKQLKESRAQLSEIFELDGEDGDFRDAADYLQRATLLSSLLRRCPHAVSEDEKTRWVGAVLGSLNLGLEEKEQIAKVAESLSNLQYEELLKVSSEESQNLEKELGGEAAQVLRSAVLTYDFFPDVPDSHLAYEQIRSCFCQYPEALRFACNLLCDKHEDEWCLKTLELAQLVLPQDAQIAYQRAWLLHQRLGRYDDAESAYRQAIAFDGSDPYFWDGFGDLLGDCLGRYDEAEAAYRQAIALDGKFAFAWISLGELLKDHLDRLDEAEAAYRQAIALDDKSAFAWICLGYLLQKYPARYDEAEAAYRQAIALDGKFAFAWISLGELLKDHLDRLDEAEAAYRQAIALDDKSAFTWICLGNLLQEYPGRYDEAEVAYRQAIALDNQPAFVWGSLGNLLQKYSSRYDEAETAFRQAIDLDEKLAFPRTGLGNLLQDHLGQHREAEIAYRQAIELGNENDFPKANLARLLWRQGRQQEAEVLYREVAALPGADKAELPLQANLCLGNRQLAVDSLHTLVLSAQEGKQFAFYRLKEQVWECHELGLGTRLAEWMAGSEQAIFLLPFIQALYMLAGEEAKLQDLPLEMQQMADEVVRIARERARCWPSVNEFTVTKSTTHAHKGKRRKMRP
ncbi:AAA family ATPase [Ferribacterium limneticum]|uniref:AAA family ATPase n=1 Tax=Ferribacterium limneticum TaxID=76259 RepID=UPI001CFA12B4|nr:AAA family ATPase [Ferribacterium limneticum]UCV29712.1 tetratricopeptide repeat protein [Ferribacterium limneticum]UCV33631.1 tetratricopeptide repeat protein [Ferribacterium limneticum]